MRYLLALLLLLPMAVMAQTGDGSGTAVVVPVSPEKAALVQKLIGLPAIGGMINKDQMNATLQDTVNRSAAAAGSEPIKLPAAALITDEDIRILTTFMNKAYADNFTLPELTKMYDFYNSPEGASIARKMPEIMAQLGPLLMQIQAAKIQNLLKSGAIKK